MIIARLRRFLRVKCGSRRHMGITNSQAVTMVSVSLTLPDASMPRRHQPPTPATSSFTFRLMNGHCRAVMFRCLRCHADYFATLLLLNTAFDFRQQQASVRIQQYTGQGSHASMMPLSLLPFSSLMLGRLMIFSGSCRFASHTIIDTLAFAASCVYFRHALMLMAPPP